MIQRVAGIMTGTSLDGIDVAICDIENKGNQPTITLVSFITEPYDDSVAENIQQALAGESTLENLSDLPVLLSQEYARVLTQLQNSLNHKATVVGVHGQTLWHHPPISTWQACNPSTLASLAGIPVVSDFRSADVALGGQGAPLVPIFDKATLQSPLHNRVALNIGGIANITVLPSDILLPILACDTGPGNMLIDAMVQYTFGKSYDANGMIARAGRVIQPMFNEVAAHPYFTQELPKSTGREMFGTTFAHKLFRKYQNPSMPSEDIVATATEITAWSIAHHINTIAPSTEQLIVSGGGVHNSFLVERIKHYLTDSIQILPSWELGISADAKEAMCFAYLAWLHLQGKPGNIPSVTHARSEAVLGTYTPVPQIV